MTVRARIVATCTIDSIDPLQFGTLTTTRPGATASDIDAQSELKLTCTEGASWTVTANDGLHASGGGQRRIANSGGTATVDYNLALDASQSIPVPATAAAAAGTPASGAGDGAQHSFTIYGRLPAGQAIPVDGDYTDTVTFTINF